LEILEGVYRRKTDNTMAKRRKTDKKLHKMTEQNPYILRIELEDFENENRYAEYQSFTVGKAESKHRLDIDGYYGDAGLF
jgi:hypothetical protein